MKAKLFRKVPQLALIFLFAASCGKKEENSELKVTFTSSANYAIDAKATSCEALHDYQVAKAVCAASNDCTSPPVLATGGVGGPYVSFGRMNMDWKRSETLTVIYARFTFRSPALSGGKYDYTLSDKALWTMWRQGTSYDPPTNPRLPDSRDAVLSNPKQSQCDVFIPNVGVTNRTITTTIPGNALIYGYYEDADLKQIPIFATSQAVNVTWLGIPP